MLVLNAAQALPMAPEMFHAGAAVSAMAMPAGTAAADHSCGHVETRHGDGPATAHAASADDCCGTTSSAGGACHCPTMCAPALLPLPVLAIGAPSPRVAHAPAPIYRTPRRPDAPPLRPPQR